MRGQVVAYRADGDRRGALDGEAVDAGADRRKGDAANAVLFRKLEAALVAAGEGLVFAVAAAFPHGADRMDYPLRRQVVAVCQHRLARVAVADRAALLPELRPRGA